MEQKKIERINQLSRLARELSLIHIWKPKVRNHLRMFSFAMMAR